MEKKFIEVQSGDTYLIYLFVNQICCPGDPVTGNQHVGQYVINEWLVTISYEM